MIVLLCYSENLYSQSKGDSAEISPTGEFTQSDSVLIGIDELRLANIKLIKADYDAMLKDNFKKIVEAQKAKIDILESNFDRQKKINANLVNEVTKAESKANKYRKQRNIAAGSSCGLLAIIVIILSL